jgi:hypothetical protein
MSKAYVLSSRSPATGEIEADVHLVTVGAGTPDELREMVAAAVFRSTHAGTGLGTIPIMVVGDDGRNFAGQNRDSDAIEMLRLADLGVYSGVVDPSDLPFDHPNGEQPSGPRF